MIKYAVFFIISVFFFLNTFCVVAQSASKQNRKIDSLKSVLYRLNSAGEFNTTIKGQSQGIDIDTIRIKTLNNLSWELRDDNVDTAIILITEALALSEELLRLETATSLKKKINKFIGDSYTQLGVFYTLNGNYPLSLDYNIKSLKIAESLNDKRGIFSSFINIGRVYNRQGNHSEALNYYFKALQNAEELQNKKGIAISFGKIGVVYD